MRIGVISVIRGEVLSFSEIQKAPFISEWSLFDFNAATTYSPTHFRVQYNRPCGA
jgi:hypothetical protein